MAPSALSYPHSHAALEALRKTRSKLYGHEVVDITLPERPRDTAAIGQASYLDDAISILGASTEHLYSTHASLTNSMAAGFTRVDGEVAAVRKDIKQLDTKIGRLGKDLRAEIADVRTEIADVRTEIAALRYLFMNRFAEGASDNIVAVERNGEVPPEFPHKVFLLWELQRQGKHHKLVRLLKFYDIDWKTWGQEYYTIDSEAWEHEDLEHRGSDSDSDDIAQSYPSLEAAVKAHPEMALRALADQLGMNYDRISKRMLKWEEAQERKKEERRIEKRKRITSLGRNTANTAPNKHRRTDAEGTDAERTSAKRTDAEELSTRLPIKDLVGNHESIEPQPSPESSTKIGWKVGSSSEGSVRRVRDIGASEAASEGSTVPFTEDEKRKLRLG